MMSRPGDGPTFYYLTQALSGHGCFNAYLRRFKKRDEKMCCYCDFPVDNAEHALFVCTKSGVAREALGQAVSPEITPDTMVFLMLQSARKSCTRLEAGTNRLRSLKPKGGSAGDVLVRERGFLVLTDMPRPVLGESCTTPLKDFAIFPPHPKKNPQFK